MNSTTDRYRDALLENDLRGLFDKWRLSDENEDDDPTTDNPDRRFNRCAADYFKAKSGANIGSAKQKVIGRVTLLQQVDWMTFWQK